MRTPRLRSGLYLLCFAFTATLVRASSVGTLPATLINASSIVLNGVANPGGASYSGYFQYGLTTNYGTSTAQQPLGSGTSNTNFSQLVTGLTSGQTYHYRADIKGVLTTITGNDQSFLMPRAPAANTAGAGPIHPGQATLNATVTPNTDPVTCWFEHGATTNYGSFTATTLLAAGNTAVAISNPVTGLPRGVPYYYRVVASNALGTAVGTGLSFAVPNGPTGQSGSAGGGLPFDIRQPALELNYLICTNGFFPGGGVSQVLFLGEICLFAGNFAPAGWTFCRGQSLSVSTNAALFDLMGNAYGGDGITNFNLPDLRGRMAVDASVVTLLPPWSAGEASGETQITMSVQNMSPHAHSLPFPDSTTGTNGVFGERYNFKPSLGITYLTVFYGFYPVQGGATIPEPFLGQIFLYAGLNAPQDIPLVMGQAVRIDQNEALFAVLGENYGGDDQNFNLPNLQARVPMGTGQGQMSLWSLGQLTGIGDIFMTQAQMPAHQHAVPTLGILTGLTGGSQPQSLMQPSMAFQFLISTNGQVPSTSVEATNAMLGEIQIFAGTNLSVVGWLPCDGRLLPIAGAPALFSVISNFYGGDGLTTFALPNLCGRTPVGSMNGQPGAAYGAEQGVMTVANLPPHTHTVPVLDFDRWATSFGLSNTAASFTADADADQAANGYEWATGTNPTNAQSLAPLTINLAGSNVNIGFPRNTNATDVVFTLLRSTNLANGGNWTGIATNLAGIWSLPAVVTETSAANPVNVIVSDPRTNTPAANYRLQITWP